MVDNRFHYFLFFPHFLGFQQQNRSFPEQSVQFDCVSFLNYIQFLFFFCSFPPPPMSLLWTLKVFPLVCSCWTRIKANLRWSRQKSILLFSSCFYYANYSQQVTHTHFQTCNFFFFRIRIHFSPSQIPHTFQLSGFLCRVIPNYLHTCTTDKCLLPM